MKSKRVIIIGAGYGGLSAAALLSKSGFDVTVIDKNNQLGGRAQIWKEKGFMFDMGPSWYLMPDVFENFFMKFGKKPSDYYKLKRLSPNYRLFFEDGLITDVPSDITGIYNLFDTLEDKGGAKLKKFLDLSASQYDTAMNKFLYKKYDAFSDLMSCQLISAGFKLNIFSSIDSFVNKYFTSKKARQIIEYTMVFLGASPYNTPALYSIMSHVDFNLGVWYPEGGFSKIADAYAKLATESNAKILLNTKCTSIMTKSGKAYKVITDKGEMETDIVISNADYHHTETELLNERDRTFDEKYWSKKIIGPSAFLIYLGLDDEVKELKHHNLYLADNWKEHFDTIFKNPSMPFNPSYYISATSKSDSSAAPEGCENIFVLVPIASGIEDNDKIREEYSSKILKHLSSVIKYDIEKHIVVKRLFSINDFKSEYNSYKGGALGLSHAFNQTAIFREPYRSRKVNNVFYTGHYTHPGIGIPMVTISSIVLSNWLEKIYG